MVAAEPGKINFLIRLKNMKLNTVKQNKKIAGVQKKFFDLVCGMELNLVEVKYRRQYRGSIYYFCNKSCKDHFDADPKKYTP